MSVFEPDASRKVADELYHERMRQIFEEGFSRDHDDRYEPGMLSMAGGCYASFASFSDDERREIGPPPPSIWPWHPDWWKPGDRRQDLVKAAALIIAEIERIDRAAAKCAPDPSQSPNLEPMEVPGYVIDDAGRVHFPIDDAGSGQ